MKVEPPIKNRKKSQAQKILKDKVMENITES